jgi:hypothetical protein
VDFEALRIAVEARQAEVVLVYRTAFKACSTVLDGSTAAWMRPLLDGSHLADALQQAGESFDFAGWLASALQSRWVAGLECR